jgi:5-methylthioadenosine/S-adenosylhomocysteine deaminase
MKRIKETVSILALAASVAGLSSFARADRNFGAAARIIDLMVEGGIVVTMDSDARVIDNGFIAIEGDRIVAVGDATSPERRSFRPRRIIDARGKAVLPGLINAHTHLPMVLYRGIADDLTLQEWLQKYIFPAEAKNTTREFVVAGTRLGLVELIRGGVTTYADMYYFEDAVAEETKKAGVRGVLGETVLDFPAPDHKTWESALQATGEFLQRWKGDPLITPAIAPHAVYTVSTKHLQEVKTLAEKYDAPILIHLAEAPTETEYTLKNYNDRPTSYLEKIGFLSSRVTGAHGVWVDDDEIELLKKREVGVAHCPQSNMKLSSGAAPAPKMIKAGVRLGLGTDGAASNNDLSMWEEIDMAAKLHKFVTKDPTVVAAREALGLATIGGARALHLEKDIGSLEPGKRADLIVVDLSAAHLTPMYNIYSLLVYAAKASDVSDTIVNGRVLMRNRRLQTMNEEAVKSVARSFQKRVSQSLKSD